MLILALMPSYKSIVTCKLFPSLLFLIAFVFVVHGHALLGLPLSGAYFDHLHGGEYPGRNLAFDPGKKPLDLVP